MITYGRSIIWLMKKEENDFNYKILNDIEKQEQSIMIILEMDLIMMKYDPPMDNYYL